MDPAWFNLNQAAAWLAQEPAFDGLLDVGVGHFIEVEFGAAPTKLTRAWRDAHAKTVLLAPLDQPPQEVDPDLGVERTDEDRPAHMPSVDHGGDDGQAVAFAVQRNNLRLALGRIAATWYVVAAQAHLVSPEDLGAFRLLDQRCHSLVAPQDTNHLQLIQCAVTDQLLDFRFLLNRQRPHPQRR